MRWLLGVDVEDIELTYTGFIASMTDPLDPKDMEFLLCLILINEGVVALLSGPPCDTDVDDWIWLDMDEIEAGTIAVVIDSIECPVVSVGM
jgi:hypothetical protein